MSLKKPSSSMADIFSYDNLIHAFAGATGSVVAMSTFFPLDTVRTRFQADDSLKAVGPVQAMKQLADEEGVASLYQGLQPVLTSLYCSNFVYFYAFNGLKTLAVSNGLPASVPRDLLFGYVSGCFNALVTTPLWVVNTRLKLQGRVTKKNENKGDNNETVTAEEKKLNGLYDGLTTIAGEEGVAALWNGVQTSFILSANPAIHFMVYEAVKRLFFKSKLSAGQKANLSSFESFLIGGFAKAVATVITYPLQLVQCKQRAYRRSGNIQLSMKEIIHKVLRDYGILGLYKGMESKLCQTVLTAALMFLTYEKIVAYIHKVFKAKTALVVR